MDDEIGKGGVAGVDVFANQFLAVAAVLVAAFLLINPPTHKSLVKPLGNMVVTATWQENVDVDLWMLGPGEVHAVGYSAKSGAHLDLLRDDLGELQPLPMHYENAVTRGLTPGEYTVNLHLYNLRGGKLPVTVIVEIDVTPRPDEPTTMLFTRTVTLLEAGDEITVVDFVLTKDGTIEPGSINHVFRPLRSANYGGGY